MFDRGDHTSSRRALVTTSMSFAFIPTAWMTAVREVMRSFDAWLTQVSSFADGGVDALGDVRHVRAVTEGVSRGE